VTLPPVTAPPGQGSRLVASCRRASISTDRRLDDEEVIEHVAARLALGTLVATVNTRLRPVPYGGVEDEPEEEAVEREEEVDQDVAFTITDLLDDPFPRRVGLRDGEGRGGSDERGRIARGRLLPPGGIRQRSLDLRTRFGRIPCDFRELGAISGPDPEALGEAVAHGLESATARRGRRGARARSH
jgi:hypothetical protein